MVPINEMNGIVKFNVIWRCNAQNPKTKRIVFAHRPFAQFDKISYLKILFSTCYASSWAIFGANRSTSALNLAIYCGENVWHIILNRTPARVIPQTTATNLFKFHDKYKKKMISADGGSNEKCHLIGAFTGYCVVPIHTQ